MRIIYRYIDSFFIQYLIMISIDDGNPNGEQGKRYNGYWQLSKRVHNRKGYELNGINFCIRRNIDEYSNFLTR